MVEQLPSGARRDESIALSVVVPVWDELESLPQLREELVAGLDATGRSWEILFADDGSTDGSGALLDRFADEDARISVVHLRKHFGKSPALAAAFERVRGDIVLTLDADLQDDPAHIPEMVARIEAGADLVSGWKQDRHDPIGKTLPSRLFNAVVRRVSGVPLRDFNCGFKAYRIACIRELSVYGGFHRFLPVLASERGFRVEELVVRHRARKHGSSKFGASRLFEGSLDLLTVLMVTRFRTRPLHLFGVLGGLSGFVGVSVLLYLTVLWFMGEPIGTRPLLTLGVLLTIASVQFIGIGLVAELLVRTTISTREVVSVREPDEHKRLASTEPTALPPAQRERERAS
ncbi:MAG TPA: glycosyltransferase family 2 protein [Nannocystaceae bacterium]|nr:glycosyltransferase family 2 protein [Nannocystaceae bacterium]